jgi:hypothetical protein
MGASGPLAHVVTIAAAIAWLTDDIEEVRDDGEGVVVAGAHLRTVATIDLLVADLFAACALLSEGLVDTVTGRLVDLLLRRVEIACRARRDDAGANGRSCADPDGSAPTPQDPA